MVKSYNAYLETNGSNSRPLLKHVVLALDIQDQEKNQEAMKQRPDVVRVFTDFTSDRCFFDRDL